MKNLTIQNIISAVNGKYFGENEPSQGEISFVTTDSRKAAEGCLFAAIKGENSDGNDFIDSALKSGALCTLGQKPPEGGGAFIGVPNTVTALGDLAAYYRSGFDIPIVGVTGSVGKTTAKEMLSCVLARRFKLHKTLMNLNNDLGVPLTLLGLDSSHQAAVIEMGISHFGEMTRLAQIVRPQMALFTAIGCAHLEFLGDLDGVLRAKSELLPLLPADGTVFVNGDDPKLASICCTQELISFGLSQGCRVRATELKLLGTEGMEFTVSSEDRNFDVKINAFGRHLVTAALGAAAVGIKMGLSDEEIAAGIADYAPVGSRSSIIKTNGCTIIDDCYNANPTSVASALSSLAMLPGRKVAILGDMFELGETAQELHYETGLKAAELGIDSVVACGTLSDGIFDGASDGGCPLPVYFSEKSMLIDALPTLLEKGDSVLVKASHSMHFEELVEALKRM